MSLAIYRNRSSTSLLDNLSRSLREYKKSKDVKIRSIIRELKTRELTSPHLIKYHRLIRKFSQY